MTSAMMIGFKTSTHTLRLSQHQGLSSTRGGHVRHAVRSNKVIGELKRDSSHRQAFNMKRLYTNSPRTLRWGSGTSLTTGRAGVVTRAAVEESELFPLPQTAGQAAQQAAEAIKEALEAGFTRQQVEVLLPVEQRRDDYMNTESMDYPDNSNTIYKTAAALAGAIIQGVEGREVGEVSVKRIDNDGMDGQVGVVSCAGSSVQLVVLPSADVLKQIKELEQDKSKVLVLLNPQWNKKGNVVSDFGFGPWKARNEQFVAQFQPTYSLTEQRIGAASTLSMSGGYMGVGGVTRILQVHPDLPQAQVFAMGGDLSSECIAVLPGTPTYKELDAIFSDPSNSLAVRRPGAEAQAGVPNDGSPSASSTTSGVKDFTLLSTYEMGQAIQGGEVSSAAVAGMDKTALRKALTACDLSTAGRLDVLKQRLVQHLEANA